MQEQIRTINYHQLFVERLVENINKISTSPLNKFFLEQDARTYDPSINGYDPESVTDYLKDSKLVVPASSAIDEGRRKRAESASLETLYRQIDSAVRSAGEDILKELMHGVRNSSDFDIQSMHFHRNGVLEFAPFYADSDEDVSAVRDRDYIELMEGAWTVVVHRNLDSAVKKIADAATTDFDVYETPKRVAEERTNLDGLVQQYSLAAREDTKNAIERVDYFERTMYQQGYDKLIMALSSTYADVNIEKTVSDVNLFVDYGRKADLSPEQLGQARLQIVTSRLELAATEFGVYETPKRMETARENLKSIAQEFDRLGITSDQEESKTKEIVNRMYGRAYYVLFPTALAGIINLDSRNKNVIQDAERALKDVQLTLDYALRGEIDNNQILDVAHEMLDENSRNDRPHRLAGIVREGVGSEMQKGLTAFDSEVAKSVERRGIQLEAEGKFLITMHPTIKSTIEEKIEGLERIEELGLMGRIGQSLAGYIDRALERHGQYAKYGYPHRF